MGTPPAGCAGPGDENPLVDPAIGILILAGVLGCYFAACNVALKRFNRKRLTERLEASGRLDRLEKFLGRLDRLILVRLDVDPAALVLPIHSRHGSHSRRSDRAEFSDECLSGGRLRGANDP